MIHLVSMGTRKAEVIVQEPSGVRRTVHLLRVGSKWANRWGTTFNLDSGEVDWFIYYRDQLTSLLGRTRSSARLAVEGMTDRQATEFIVLVQQLAREARTLHPELREEA